MADVITLDGLENAQVAGTAECGSLISVHSPVLGQSIRVCEVDAKRMAAVGAVSAPIAGRRGRPKGSTVKRGAKRPKLKKCNRAKLVTTKTGRKLCKCADPGNGQILSSARCRLPRRKK